VSSKNPLFTHFSSALENVLGERLTYQMGPLSDIRFPLRRGVDAAAFGPIRKDSNVHKPDENVRIKDLVQCTRVYQHFICALDGTQSL
jgi:acetylornithine deacetylase/succinyl-diaminopimelate desuccinylase-like protein